MSALAVLVSPARPRVRGAITIRLGSLSGPSVRESKSSARFVSSAALPRTGTEVASRAAKSWTTTLLAIRLIGRLQTSRYRQPKSLRHFAHDSPSVGTARSDVQVGGDLYRVARCTRASCDR